MDAGGARVSGPVGSREEILAYIHGLLGTISGVTAMRDRGDFTKEELPVIVMLDGDEELATDVSRSTSMRMGPAVYTLKPEIVFVAKPRNTVENELVDGTPAPIGPELSSWRDKIYAAIMNDAGLAALLTPNGRIVYCGMASDMKWNATMTGALQLYFEFNYVLVPPRP